MITQPIATAAFEVSGLDAMGLASGQLAAQWAESTPTFDAAAMALTCSGPALWRAPAGGMLHWSGFGAPDLTDAEGEPLALVVAVLRLHPQTLLRVRRLIGARFDGRTDGRAGRPVPVCAAIRDGHAPPELAALDETDPPLPPLLAPAGTPLTFGRLTFHDEQGLIVDPIAVACLFRDLMRGFPALRKPDAGVTNDLEAATGSSGSIGKTCALASGTRVHLVDLFGLSWTSRPGGPGVRLGTGAALDAGPHDWPDGQTLQPTSTTGGARFALSPQGTLATTAVSRPALPVTVVPVGSSAPVLDREFFRLVVVDLDLHLIGNRTAGEVSGVPAPDEATRSEPLPVVRDGGVDFLADGQATLGAVSEVAALLGFRLAVSPELATDVAFPVDRIQRWPAQPSTPVAEPAVDLDAATAGRARTELTAAFIAATPDVVVTWPAGAVPAQAHVRLFPRVDPGPATVPLAEIDFARRGEGGAGIATAAGLALRLRDPFRVGTGTRPFAPTLIADLLMVTRGPGGVQGRLFGGVSLPVADGGVEPPAPPVSNGLAALPNQQRGLGPSPLLGLPPTQPATGTDPVLALLDLATPREAARFRTMARTESIVAGHDGATPGSWTAVLTPGFLSGRSVRDDARLGNPGHPAGPEEHAPGIRVTGALAADLARAALRRTHHLSVRIPELAEDRWTDPPAAAGTAVGAVLSNVAQTVDAPELALLPAGVLAGLPDDWTHLMSQVAVSLPSSLSGLPTTAPAPAAGDRWVREFKRDAQAADHGRRDTQWALRWALSRARRLVYVETALFGETGSPADHEKAVDLVELLRARLHDVPNLRIVVVLPKRIPFGPGYEPFAQRHHQRRNTGLVDMSSPATDRVIAYHPVGFPGRPEVCRGSLVVIDDVWALVGTSSWSRRGLTFDSSTDVSLVGTALRDGSSAGIADLRRAAMARLLGVAAPAPASPDTPDPRWVQLAQPQSAFRLMAQTLAQGGDGLLEPLWPGLPETDLPALDPSIADPDGRGFSDVLQLFASVLSGLGSTGA